MTAIVLIGMMGSGKSTVANLIAEQTGRRVVDSDVAIEARTGLTVRELWEDDGEAAYRAMESAVVIDALGDPDPVVIAAPGGVILDPAVRSALEGAFVAWLRAEPATLAARVRPGDHRPLLGDQPEAAFRTMASERDALYTAAADAIIDVDRLDPLSTANQVLELFTGVENA